MTETKREQVPYVLTKPVIMAFPNLFVPKAFKGKNGKELGEPKYSANFILEPDGDDFKQIKDVCAKMAKARWPDKPLSSLSWPFTGGNKLADAAAAKKKDGEYQRGKIVIAARSKYPAKLAIFLNGKIHDLVDDAEIARFKGQFYPGVLVYAQFNFDTHEVGSNTPGVNAYLQMVLSTNKGTRLAGGKTAAETFAGYVGTLSNDDPTAGQRSDLDDEIPF